MGLRTIIEKVAAQLHERPEFLHTVVTYGTKAVAKQTNQAAGRADRVVFEPADQAGTVGAPVRPGQPIDDRGRAVATWKEPIAVHCWAWDPLYPNDQLAQDDAARRLTTAVLAELAIAIHGAVEWGTSGPRYTRSPVEVKFGAEYVFTFLYPIRAAELVDAPTHVKAGAVATASMTTADETSVVLTESITIAQPEG